MPSASEEFGNEGRSGAESFRTVPKAAEEPRTVTKPDSGELKELKDENMDLKITNRAKDYFIEQLQKERAHLLKQVVDSSQRVGQLEAQILQLGSALPERR